MALYRVLRTLYRKDRTIPAGDFIAGDSYAPKALDKLEEVGAISLLHAPPLSELPGFEGTEQLAAIGIVNADQLLECNIDETIKRLNIYPSTLRDWCAEVKAWLIAPARAGQGG